MEPKEINRVKNPNPFKGPDGYDDPITNEINPSGCVLIVAVLALFLVTMVFMSWAGYRLAKTIWP